MIWTRTELSLFKEYEGLMCDYADIAEWNPGGVTVGSYAYDQLQQIGEQLESAREILQERMGKTRFDALMNSRINLRKWRGEITARMIRKRPELEPQDCRPGWE